MKIFSISYDKVRFARRLVLFCFDWTHATVKPSYLEETSCLYLFIGCLSSAGP